MPADITALRDCLAKMKQSYLSNPGTSVRGQGFIHFLHEYCVSQLRQAIADDVNIQVVPLADMNRSSGKIHYPRSPIDPSGYQLMQEATLFGSHKNKDTDVVLSHYANGPQIIIGVRSQMSSTGNNLLTYYEDIIGECVSLHDRFPMSAIGYVYLLPDEPIKPGKSEAVKLDRAEALFRKITGRQDWRDTHDRYEHFAFLKVNFKVDPPSLLSVGNPLKIDDFFDKLIDTHNDRNVFNQIKKR